MSWSQPIWGTSIVLRERPLISACVAPGQAAGKPTREKAPPRWSWQTHFNKNVSVKCFFAIVVKCSVCSPQSFEGSLGKIIHFGTHPTHPAALIPIKQQLYKKCFILIAVACNGAEGRWLYNWKKVDNGTVEMLDWFNANWEVVLNLPSHRQAIEATKTCSM